jgi:hydrogenase nickel incorporation protein HypB
MCETCGCNLTHGNEHLVAEDGHLAHTASGTESVEVLKGLLDANDHQAQHNREHFDQHRVLAVNLMSSPGSGKTSLLEATIDELAGDLNIAVIEGDLETENDANRIREKGVAAIQICTGSACHLDAHMLHTALHELTLNEVDVLFIENVGNLVCPASFDLGQHLNVALLSSPEGDDKPAKYPVMFRAADVVLITKSDLLEVLGDFDPERAASYVRQLANPAPLLTLSARNGLGMKAWFDWILDQISLHRRRLVVGKTDRPKVQPDGVTLHVATHTHDAADRR